MKNKFGINEKNRKFLDSLNRFGKNLFSIEEASRILELSVEKTRFILSYFARRGWLARVKRGLYVSVPLGIINPWEYKENPWIVANRIFSPCYIGGWSAAEYWNLTEQIFNSICIFTSRSFRNKNTNVQGTNFILKFCGENLSAHTKIVWIENVKIFVSDHTQTIVDILNDPLLGGGIRHTADIIEAYFESDIKEEDKLLNYIEESKNRTIYKRLGFILEKLKISSDKLKQECLKNISKGYSVLDPSIKNKGTYNRKWNLRVNAEIR